MFKSYITEIHLTCGKNYKININAALVQRRKYTAFNIIH